VPIRPVEGSACGTSLRGPANTVPQPTSPTALTFLPVAGRHGPPRPGRLPVAVYAVAPRLQSIDRGTARPGAVPTRARARHRRRLAAPARSHLTSSAGGDIAVIIEPAHPGNAAPLLLSAQGLTPANATLRCSVLRGASTQAIAAELHLSAYTVKDHLKSICGKTGVRSRRDLVARVLTGPRGAPAPRPAPGVPHGRELTPAGTAAASSARPAAAWRSSSSLKIVKRATRWRLVLTSPPRHAMVGLVTPGGLPEWPNGPA
jgi:DNA-binding CsgD family transcriptional regulator